MLSSSAVRHSSASISLRPQVSFKESSETFRIGKGVPLKRRMSKGREVRLAVAFEVGEAFEAEAGDADNSKPRSCQSLSLPEVGKRTEAPVDDSRQTDFHCGLD